MTSRLTESGDKVIRRRASILKAGICILNPQHRDVEQVLSVNPHHPEEFRRHVIEDLETHGACNLIYLCRPAGRD